jgi:hypothetical protein
MISSTLAVIHLDGSCIHAAGSGVVIIRPPGDSQLLALWLSYYYPLSPQHTFPPNSIKHYLQIPSVFTEHSSRLNITITPEINIKFQSFPAQLKTTGLEYFQAEVIHPHVLSPSEQTFIQPHQPLPPLLL